MKRTTSLGIIGAGLVLATTTFAAIPAKINTQLTVKAICAKFKRKNPGEPCNNVYINCTGLGTIYVGTIGWLSSITIDNHQILADPGISNTGIMGVTLSDTQGAPSLGNFPLTLNPKRDVNKIMFNPAGAAGNQIKVEYTPFATCN